MNRVRERSPYDLRGFPLEDRRELTVLPQLLSKVWREGLGDDLGFRRAHDGFERQSDTVQKTLDVPIVEVPKSK